MASPDTTAIPALPAWRRYPIGVELSPDGELAHARVWAPRRRSVELVRLSLSGEQTDTTALDSEPNGYFSGPIPSATPETRYKLRLDGEVLIPDAVSRFQPEGPHGPSAIVDGRGFRWTDSGWRGVPLEHAVIYELHVGTFTPAGTYRGATEKLPHLAELGVTVIELMPLAEFPGRFGWGYDGVGLFAPYHHYGTPNELRSFIDAAHAHGIAVLHDVVYNHLGPDGNYLTEFSEHYFKGKTEWGDALNFDGNQSAPVREFVVSNAAYWVEEFHFDGLRIDATQQIFDTSKPHILTELSQRVQAAGDESGRVTLLIGENEPQDSRLVTPADEGGCGLDALWNDDFHHSAMVALTGRDEAYYSGYRGSPQEFISVAKYGFLYQGEWLEWQQQRRGSPAFGVWPAHFINFTQNHDQVANAAAGLRAHQLSSPARYRAITAFLLLAPQTPMLFQGQEFEASAPFLYFADHKPDLAELVSRGRAEFLGQFASIATPETTRRLSEPSDPATFARCKLDWEERDRGSHAAALALVRDLLRLRRDDPTLQRRGSQVDGAVITDSALLLRVFGAQPDLDRLIVMNLGRAVHPVPFAEPLAAPPRNMLWRPIWSSESARYGGGGTPSVDADEGGWWLPAESTIVLSGLPRDAAPRAPGLASSEKAARAAWKRLHDAPPR